MAAAIGSAFTIQEIPTWYATLEKPFYTPPNWVFGPVWTILYLLQGIAFYLVLQAKKVPSTAVPLFLAQLVFNTLWSVVFFGAHLTVWALLIIVVLLWLVFLTIRAFKEASPLAAKLLWPYIAWLSFATLLNIGIIVVNK